MSARRIVVNAQVRALLQELDEVLERFHEKTRTLSDSGLPHNEAVNVGAAREVIRTQIVGLAWRINKASTGREGGA